MNKHFLLALVFILFLLKYLKILDIEYKYLIIISLVVVGIILDKSGNLEHLNIIDNNGDLTVPGKLIVKGTTELNNNLTVKGISDIQTTNIHKHLYCDKTIYGGDLVIRIPYNAYVKEMGGAVVPDDSKVNGMMKFGPLNIKKNNELPPTGTIVADSIIAAGPMTSYGNITATKNILGDNILSRYDIANVDDIMKLKNINTYEKNTKSGIYSNFLKIVPIDGSTIKCSDDNISKDRVYRYSKSNGLQYYPNTDISNSWNPNWKTDIQTITCNALPNGSALKLKV